MESTKKSMNANQTESEADADQDRQTELYENPEGFCPSAAEISKDIPCVTVVPS